MSYCITGDYENYYIETKFDYHIDSSKLTNDNITSDIDKFGTLKVYIDGVLEMSIPLPENKEYPNNIPMIVESNFKNPLLKIKINKH